MVSLFLSSGAIEELQNETVNGLLEQLIEDLKNKEQYQEYEDMNEKHRRKALLMMLYQNVQTRRFKVSTATISIKNSRHLLNNDEIFNEK